MNRPHQKTLHLISRTWLRHGGRGMRRYITASQGGRVFLIRIPGLRPLIHNGRKPR